jgi:hypothetical protein
MTLAFAHGKRQPTFGVTECGDVAVARARRIT